MRRGVALFVSKVADAGEDLQKSSWEPRDAGFIHLAPEQCDGSLNVVSCRPHPAELLTVLHQVSHVAIGCYADCKAMLPIFCVDPQDVQGCPASSRRQVHEGALCKLLFEAPARCGNTVHLAYGSDTPSVLRGQVYLAQ